MPKYNPHRINLAADYLGGTTTSLAQKIDVSRSYLGKIINGERAFTEDIAERLSFVTNLPITFFLKPDPALVQLEDLTFRKKGQPRKSAIMQCVSEYRLVTETLTTLYDMCSMQSPASLLNEYALRDAPTEQTLEQYALTIRQVLHCDASGPIRNLAACLDEAHIPIVALTKPPVDGKTDGLSAPTLLDAPVAIGVHREGKTGDRLRFTVAHELGHLLLHRFRKPASNTLAEQEANRFAGALLLPEHDIAHAITDQSTLRDYAAIKQGWGISIAATIYRSHQLGLINDSRYSSLYTQLSRLGWHKQEPITVHPEEPLLMQQLTAVAFGDTDDSSRPTASRHGVEGFLGVPFDTVNHWCWGALVERESAGIGGFDDLLG